MSNLLKRSVFLIFAFLNSHAANAAPSPLVSEVQLWRRDGLLQQLAKKMNPLGQEPGDGSVGLNRKFPEKVLVDHQAEGWNWIRAGVALGNGYIIDRGIMAFEWAFARMTTEGAGEGSFGESKTVEIANFLGLYARSVSLLRDAKQEERAKRLERLIPRLEASLRSPRSLLGERRWDAAEKRNWVTQQRVQAAAAAFWIGKLLGNPKLKKTADLWLDEALKRQEATGFFPTGEAATAPNLRSTSRSQVETLEALQGLAWADAGYAIKLKAPIAKAFKWIQVSKAKPAGSPITFATYAAWTKDAFAAKTARLAVSAKTKK